MFRVSNLFTRSRTPNGGSLGLGSSRNSSQSAINAEAEAEAECKALEHALAAANLILNDDIAGAEAGLVSTSTSSTTSIASTLTTSFNHSAFPFHKVAAGVLAFMKAVLGAEQEVMKDASARLAEAEASAGQSLARAQRSGDAAASTTDGSRSPGTSAIYERGSEFMLCQAEAQVMMAIVGVLNESLTESIRGFYKLRKAYLTLDQLARMEDRFVRSHESGAAAAAGTITADPDSAIFASPLNVFIHTGTNLMFGVLNLLISIVPPTFSKLLFVVGFRGDRERGLRMLWQASKFHNINGGLAALFIFGWYNGLNGFCDIMPDEPERDGGDEDDDATASAVGYPVDRLEDLLRDMRQRYPQSNLWRIEEARMATSADRDLDRALSLLAAAGEHSAASGTSSLKQIEAMRMFEMALDSMYAHRYALCADSFLQCVHLNDWSQALYYYIAGAAHVAVYREAVDAADADAARRHKALADEYIRLAPTKIGRKKMMGRQLPFEQFVVRKVAKWTERLSAAGGSSGSSGSSLVDVIGVSPLEEMVYLWGGYKKMDAGNLAHSLRNLEWTAAAAASTDTDERTTLALLRSVVLRHLGRAAESTAALQAELRALEQQARPGASGQAGTAAFRDEWAAPAVHHEIAVNLWQQRAGYRPWHSHHAAPAGSASSNVSAGGNVSPGSQGAADDAGLVAQVKTHIERAKNWGTRYELDARLGLKITAALNSIRLWEERHGGA